MRKIEFLVYAVALLGLTGELSGKAAEQGPIPEVTAVPETLRQEADLSPFYQKYTHAGPLPILGSAQVSDYALREAVWIVQHVLAGRDDILQALADRGVRMVIMAHNEYTTDIPEQANMTPKDYWDRRARGLGGRIISGAEENLLCFPGDPYSTENILIHEFAHVIQQYGMRSVDPTFDRRLRAAYEQARAAGLWEGTYAGSNMAEYWAEAVQDWFDNNRQNDGVHNHVNTRSELKAYDPNLAVLVAEVLGERDWRYQKPMERDAAGRTHLAGYDPSKAPRFRWRQASAPVRPRVMIQTELGDIEAELYPDEAPITVANFLRYVDGGFFTGGSFFRTVTMDNQPNDQVKIQVIQCEANPEKEGAFFAPIVLERTRDTGVKHLDGALSMARSGPDTAQHSFSICIGAQPDLDFGGKRNPDGQGFAAFGRVTKGMDVAHKIHESPTEGQKLTPSIRIRGVVRAQ
jgi:cyclophilin family peptidyl-prolyl cis-trans isomerase